MENINSPFSVIQNNQHLNRNGSGLGLYITKEILSLCGSELKYNSKKGIGSQFWFEIDDSNSIIDPTMILNDNFKKLINEINHGIKDKHQTYNTNFVSEKTDSELYNIKVMNENDLKQNSIKTFQFKNRKKNSNFITFSKNSEILTKNMNNKLFVNKNMLDIRLRNIANTLLCPRAFTLSSDFKSANNTAILLNNSMKTYKILICDDDRLTALSTQNSLLKYYKSSNNNKNPPDILLAQNGIECLYIIYSNYIKESAINLLLIDKNMPFIDGVTTCTLLKNIVELNDIKIYMLSSECEIKECKVDGYYEKPISNQAIEEIIKILYEES